MKRRVVVVGAGMGGLAAALRLSGLGFGVRVIEARAEGGGLASGFEAGGLFFDGGPYILLDRPGLEWAFGALGLDLAEQVALQRVEEVYEVASADHVLRFHADLAETAAGFDRIWPGAGRRYTDLVGWAREAHRRLEPALFVSRPGLREVLRGGAWREAALLLRSLGSILGRTGLPPPVAEAIAIWTHVAGQRLEVAPAFMAFVPALIHGAGAFYPVGGLASVPQALERAAGAAGIDIERGSRVRAIRCADGLVTGVETNHGFVEADAVVSNAGGVGTYLELVQPTPAGARARLEALPLQSPGVCAYLAVRGTARPPYLRFSLPRGDESCRLFIAPQVVVPHPGDGPRPARLLGPMDHGRAVREGAEGQGAYLEKLLAEPWWRESLTEVRVVARRLPADWGREFSLYRDSMNPVMTARFMRAGRLAHRSPWVRGLYLAGSATHPGQWVSFCAISGILAAECVREDLA